MRYIPLMTRTEALAQINDRLSRLDDEDVIALADHMSSLVEPLDRPRRLSDEELALIAQSRADFAAGRTLSAGEYEAEMSAFLADLRTRHPATR